jgi:hypothetical protein
MTIAERHGKIVDLKMYHMVGRPNKVEEFVEHHREAMHTPEEYMEAFKKVGLTVDYDEQGLIGRGLFMGLKPF